MHTVANLRALKCALIQALYHALQISASFGSISEIQSTRKPESTELDTALPCKPTLFVYTMVQRIQVVLLLPRANPLDAPICWTSAVCDECLHYPMCEMSAVVIIHHAIAEATNLYAHVQDDTACWRSSTAWPECFFSGRGTRCREGAQQRQEVELTGPVHYAFKPCYFCSARLYIVLKLLHVHLPCTSCCNAKIRSLCVCTALSGTSHFSLEMLLYTSSPHGLAATTTQSNTNDTQHTTSPSEMHTCTLQ